jgi:hypothetical protein
MSRSKCLVTLCAYSTTLPEYISVDGIIRWRNQSSWGKLPSTTFPTTNHTEPDLGSLRLEAGNEICFKFIKIL